MVDKIRDDITGGTYSDGALEPFVSKEEYPEKLGVTGKINQFIDEVGQVSELQTTASTVITAINELKLRADEAVLLDTGTQTLQGTYTFGSTTGTADMVFFNHDVEFRGSVQFNSGGDTLNLANTFISLGDDQSVSPVGDGGIILERGLALEDVRIFWDESETEWRLKRDGAELYDIYHQGNVVGAAKTFLETGEFESRSFIALTNQTNPLDNKSVINLVQDGTGTVAIAPASDDFSTIGSAYAFERDGVNTTRHLYFINSQLAYYMDDTNFVSTRPIKVDRLSENTTDNGIRIENLHIKDQTFGVVGTNNVTYTNTNALFNPDAEAIDFTVMVSTGMAFKVDATDGEIRSLKPHHFENGLYGDDIFEQTLNHGIDVHDNMRVLADITVESESPNFRYYKTNSATDEKYWDFGGATSSAFTIKALPDDLAFQKNAYVIGRTGTSINSHNFYVSDSVEFKVLEGDFSFTDGTNDTITNLRVKSKTGFDSALRYEHDGILRGSLMHDASDNSLNLSKYNASSVYLGGINLYEDRILVDNLPFEIEGVTKVNAIQPLSGTTNTFNQDVRVVGDLTVDGELIIDNIRNKTIGSGIDIENFLLDNGTLEARASRPSMTLLETDRVLNEKAWGIESEGGNLSIFTASDDLVSKYDVMTFNRNGYGTTSVDILTPTLKIKPNGNAGSSTEIALVQIDSGSSSPQALYFNKDGVRQAYMYSAPDGASLRIAKSDTTTGNMTCNIDMTDTSITLSDETTINSNLKVNDIFERTSAHGVNIDGNLLKDSTILSQKITTSGGQIGLSGDGSEDFLSFNETNNYLSGYENGVLGNINIHFGEAKLNNVLTDDINEKTANHGVDIEGIGHKDGILKVSTIETTSSLIVNLDSNNDQTTAAFIINDNGTTPRFIVFDEGYVHIKTTASANALSMVDEGATDATNANIYMDFDYATTSGGSATRMGYIGYGTSANQDLYVANQLSDGDLRLISDRSVYVDLDGDNNDTSSAFAVRDNASTDRFIVFDEGTTHIKSQTATEVLALYDEGATDATNAATYMAFRYATSAGGSSTRMGYLGFQATSNKDMYLRNELDGGDIRLQADTNIYLNTNVGGSGGKAYYENKEIATIEERVAWIPTSVTSYAASECWYVDHGSSVTLSFYVTMTGDNLIGGVPFIPETLTYFICSNTFGNYTGSISNANGDSQFMGWISGTTINVGHTTNGDGDDVFGTVTYIKT